MAWNPEDVISSPGSTDPNLLKTLALSDELEQAIYALLDPETYELASNEPNFVACFQACQLAMEHGQALRALVSSQFPPVAAHCGAVKLHCAPGSRGVSTSSAWHHL